MLLVNLYKIEWKISLILISLAIYSCTQNIQPPPVINEEGTLFPSSCISFQLLFQYIVSSDFYHISSVGPEKVTPYFYLVTFQERFPPSLPPIPPTHPVWLKFSCSMQSDFCRRERSISRFSIYCNLQLILHPSVFIPCYGRVC